MTITFTIEEIIKSDALIDASGLNPYCIKEGMATGEEEIQIPLCDLKRAGFDILNFCDKED